MAGERHDHGALPRHEPSHPIEGLAQQGRPAGQGGILLGSRLSVQLTGQGPKPHAFSAGQDDGPEMPPLRVHRGRGYLGFTARHRGLTHGVPPERLPGMVARRAPTGPAAIEIAAEKTARATVAGGARERTGHGAPTAGARSLHGGKTLDGEEDEVDVEGCAGGAGRPRGERDQVVLVAVVVQADDPDRIRRARVSHGRQRRDRGQDEGGQRASHRSLAGQGPELFIDNAR